MNRFLYSNLARNNIKKNNNTFLPFGLSCGTMIALFYMLVAIKDLMTNTSFFGHDTMGTILGLGIWVSGIFSVAVIFYTNSFLMKRRTKELGLYSILGLEKKHIGKVLFWEIAMIGIVSLIGGLIAGMLFSKLMFLVLLKIVNLNSAVHFNISIKAIIDTSLIFSGVFVVIILYNYLRLIFLKPIELLKGENVGEKEPKAKWIMAIIGGICVGIGYYLAINTKNPIQAMSIFFIAVLFVIAGTYLLFMSGSIAFLKILKKNKRYYYHKTHFVTVSGMIYRMKQNAVGLANICILSTAVLVVLSSTVSLFLGLDDVLKTRYPSDVVTNYLYQPQGSQKDSDYYNKIQSVVEAQSKKYNVKVYDIKDYFAFTTYGSINKEKFTYGESITNSGVLLEVITLSDYNRLNNSSQSLDKGDVLIYSSKNGGYNGSTISFGDHKLQIKKHLNSFSLDGGSYGAFETVNLVVSDLDEIIAIKDIVNKDIKNGKNDGTYNFSFNLIGNLHDKKEFGKNLRDALNSEKIEHVAEVSDIYTSKQDFLNIYGTLFFIGIFIGSLFIITTVLIIYYKQISEGYDDRRKFAIMQNVGMGNDEVKKVIKNQILTVFFLPIIVAVVHICFAFDIIKKMLAVLQLTNVGLFINCTIGTVLIFAVVYSVIYVLTARTNYKIVNE